MNGEMGLNYFIYPAAADALALWSQTIGRHRVDVEFHWGIIVTVVDLEMVWLAYDFDDLVPSWTLTALRLGA